jgi:hypothetical protein
MQHIILVLAMILLLGIAGKEFTGAKMATDSRLLQIEKVQAANRYQLPQEDNDDCSYEFNVGSCYTDLFQ